MDGIASLLAGTSDASHAAPRKLPQDPGEWAGEILRLIGGLLPPELPVQPQVHFNQQDEVNGFGMGSVYLATRDGDVKAFVPVIVRRFTLQPLDVLVSDNKFLPFTERHIRNIFASTAMDDGTIDMWRVREGANEDLQDDTNPGSVGLYPYAGATMGREDFLQTLDPGDQADLKALVGDTSTLGILHALQKEAAVHELMRPVLVDEPPEAREIVTTILKRASAEGDYVVMTSHEGAFGPTISTVTESGMRAKVKELVPEDKDDWLNRVHRSGSATHSELEEAGEKNLAEAENINQGPRGSEVFLYRTDRAQPEQGKDHCPCIAMTKSGQRIRGMLLPKVIDLDGSAVNTKLFVGRGVSGVQPTIAIERLSGVVDLTDDIDAAQPAQGDTGTFVHADKGGDVVALVPLTIDSMWTSTNDGAPSSFPSADDLPSGATMTINGRTLKGDRVELVVGKARGIIEITPQWWKTEGSAPKRRRYSVSSEFRWVPMGDFKEFMENPRVMRDADDLEKKASVPELRVIDTGLGYEFQAPWVKTAQALLEKQGGFLDVPSKAKMLRAALMGAGVGAAGLAAGAGAVGAELAPEAVRSAGERAGVEARNAELQGKALGYAVNSKRGNMLQEHGAREFMAGRPLSGIGGMIDGASSSLLNRLAYDSTAGDIRKYQEARQAAAESRPFGDFFKGGAASVDLAHLSAPEARHMLCEWGLNVATADGVLKAASERGSIRVRGIEDPIAKFAAHPFLAMPSRGRMLRAALMGTGLGAAGLAGGGLAAGASAVNELRPEAIQRLKQQKGLYENRVGLLEESLGHLSDASAAHDVAYAPLPALGASPREFADAIGRSGRARIQALRAMNQFDQSSGKADRYLEAIAASRSPSQFGGDFFTKTQSANPAVELIAALRSSARGLFPKLAYVAGAHYRRARGMQSDENRLAKLAEADDSIDAALELNFLNPQNLSYFIGLKPKMEEVLHNLGRLLIAVRMGLPEVDEEVVRTTFKQLDTIIRGLSALSFAETDG